MSELCDRFETLISAWMDDELDRREAREMLDHLTRCRSCRGFYRDARALEGVVIVGSTAPETQVQTSASSTASSELWTRIEDDARPARKRRGAKWTLRAAALVFVALALAFVVVPRVDFVGDMGLVLSDRGEIRVELGSRQGEMTEDRFLQIATEVLEADRRYQRAMFQVMDSVMGDQAVTEGGGDAMVDQGERRRADENAGGRA